MTDSTHEHETPTLERPRVLQGSLSRYEIHVDGSGTPAGVTWFQDVDTGGTIDRVFPHTEVDDEFSGHGLASRLVREALDQTIAEGFRIVPVCPYVKRWIERHDGYSEHAATPTPDHLQALEGR